DASERGAKVTGVIERRYHDRPKGPNEPVAHWGAVPAIDMRPERVVHCRYFPSNSAALTRSTSSVRIPTLKPPVCTQRIRHEAAKARSPRRAYSKAQSAK